MKQTKKVSQQIRAPMCIGKLRTFAAPSIKRSARDVEISHTEMFTGITTGALPTGAQAMVGSSVIASFEVSPKNSAVFPWLSAMTDRYQMYEWKSLRFNYVPRCSTSIAGMMVMAFDYDVLDPTVLFADFDGRSTLLSHEGAVSGPCWTPFSMAVPKSRLDLFKNRFTATGEHSTGGDRRLNSAGTLFVAHFGGPAFTWLGDIEVEYTICLKIPEIPSPVSDDASESAVVYRVGKPDQASFETDGICDVKCLPTLTKGSSTQYPFTWDIATMKTSDKVNFELGVNPVDVSQSTNTSGIKFNDDFEGTLELVCPVTSMITEPECAARTYTQQIWDPVAKAWAQCQDQQLASGQIVQTGRFGMSGVARQSPYLLFNAIGTFLKGQIYRYYQTSGPALVTLAGSITASLLKRSYNNLLKNNGITTIISGRSENGSLEPRQNVWHIDEKGRVTPTFSSQISKYTGPN